MPEPTLPPALPASGAFDEAHERRVALGLTAIVLATLTAVKPLGGVPYLGVAGYTVAAALQLYLPIRRADRVGAPLSAVGLHLTTWRRDLRLVLLLCAVTFPPYALAHHLYMTELVGWVHGLGLHELARWLPHRALAPALPHGLSAWGASAWWLGGVVATHVLGVALPEETFYRGYLQPRLETVWTPSRRVLGVRLGLAAVVTAALFASGHFLGEWNPLRLGPFVPALLFAWLRNATGSVAGAVAYHGACNVLGEVLFALYRPV